jgi:hypothetical protein
MIKSPPGYLQLKRLDAELPLLSRPARTALAAACATRTLPILFNYFGDTELCERALELCWRFAADEPLDAPHNERVSAECEELVNELYDDDERGCNLWALNAVIFALDSTFKPEPRVAADAVLQARDASTGDAIDDADSDARVIEEADWQMKALDLISTLRPPFTRTWFKEIDTEPNWLRAYRRERWVRG